MSYLRTKGSNNTLTPNTNDTTNNDNHNANIIE